MDPDNLEFLTLRFRPEAREEVFGALGGLLANDTVEVIFDTHEERPYNPDIVERMSDPSTGEQIPFISLTTLQRTAVELGMEEAMGTRVQEAITRHFRLHGQLDPEGPQVVRADRLPGLVSDLRDHRTQITNLGSKSLELLEHLLGRLYLPSDET